MLLDYKVAVLVGPSGLSSHQRMHLKETMRTVTENTNNSILVIPGYGVGRVQVDPYLKEQARGPVQVILKGFSKASHAEAIAQWLQDLGCDQYVAYPGIQHENLDKCRVWAVSRALGKSGIHVTTSLPWIKQSL